MNPLKIYSHAFCLLLSLTSCCIGEDFPNDNTVVLRVFKLDKSDNLFDNVGSRAFNTIHVRYTNPDIELQVFSDSIRGEIAFLPFNGAEESADMGMSELILELDSASYSLNLSYSIEDESCAGALKRIGSYEFEGTRFPFDTSLRFNHIDLLIDP